MKKNGTKREPTSKRVVVFRVAALAVLLIVAALMFVIGRGHTIYPENKSFEYEGKTYEAPYKVTIWDGAEKVGKLSKKDRGQIPCIGQTFQVTVDVEWEKGGQIERIPFTMKVPYGMDNVLINVPAMLAGLPQEVWMEEFFLAVEEPTEDEDVPGTGDEFGTGEEFGIGGEV